MRSEGHAVGSPAAPSQGSLTGERVGHVTPLRCLAPSASHRRRGFITPWVDSAQKRSATGGCDSLSYIRKTGL